MCAAIRELSIPLSDLKRVVITCTRCQSETTFDLLLAKQNPDPMAKTTATPEVCSVCETPFPQHAQESVDALREAFRGVDNEKKSLTVAFRIPAPSALP